jgi:hypothetical protein
MRLRADLRAERRREAQTRNARWASLTPAQKLDDLDVRLGIGRGAEKQRKKLNAAISAAKKEKKS